MIWYNNMTEQQRKDFKKVVAVIATGVVFVLLIPMLF